MNATKALRTAALVGALIAGPALASGPTAAADITVYKSPSCGCCGKWVDHMRANGHSVTVKEMEDLGLIKKMARVPEKLESCHTALVDGYVVEGHVPAADVARLLKERPKAADGKVLGLSVPGMPAGSPGMEGGEPERYDTLLFRSDGSASVFARH